MIININDKIIKGWEEEDITTKDEEENITTKDEMEANYPIPPYEYD